MCPEDHLYHRTVIREKLVTYAIIEFWVPVLTTYAITPCFEEWHYDEVTIWNNTEKIQTLMVPFFYPEVFIN
jgi:hypothetical protein